MRTKMMGVARSFCLNATVPMGAAFFNSLPRQRAIASRGEYWKWIKMSLGLRVVLLACVMSAIELAAGISIAPGDEEGGICQSLRSTGVAPTPSYTPNMKVLMDSWNYQNLLPARMGAVWEQVDNDTSNSGGMTTNVSFQSIL
jgi:hypothetical protein